MLFNSFQYFIFLPVVLVIYFLLPKVSYRNLFLLLASYFFYMCWQPVFIVLILISTLTDYVIGKRMGNTSDHVVRKRLLYVSLLVNLGIFFYFKYFNFLSDNLELLLSMIGLDVSMPAHSYMLPVGISFYTFQTLSYTIDLYRNTETVEHNFVDFSLYVSFFPQLVAGPIERSTNLLPQFKVLHQFDYSRFRIGALLILIGLFKKLAIADRFAIYADEIFLSPENYNGLSVMLGTVFFSFQIYGDFSGYTDIAIGSAWILGIKLMDNFKGPYFSLSVKEFWQRWHISLSTWFRDYLYIPLGGNRLGSGKMYRNLLIVFLVTAIWHGANWTFVLWGLFHGALLIAERLGFSRVLDKLPAALRVLYVFVAVSFAWIFFRAQSVSDAFMIIKNIFVYEEGNLLNHDIYVNPVESLELYISLVLLLLVMIFHYFEYKYNVVEKIAAWNILSRWSVYVFLVLCIAYLGEYGYYKEFIYFQF